MEIKKWYDSINKIIAGEAPSECPYCNSKNTDYRMVQISDELGTADIWCNECKKAIHLSRIRVPDDKVKECILPKLLEY